MKTEQIALAPLAPGSHLSLTVHRFGKPGARPRVYVQAALHADEIPGMIAAHHLRGQLEALEAEGRIAGEIVLVPSANPIGLSQKLLGQPVGRFDLANGANFNRGYPNVVAAAGNRVETALTADPQANVRLVRQALLDELAGWKTHNPADVLKKTLLALAIDADYVLDLHCDAEAVVHLYTHTRSAEALGPLSALLGARAVLVAEVSGDDPFDEACSRPWAELADRFPDRPIPMACHATTLEFRGEADVSDDWGSADAAALVAFMTLCGAIAGEKPAIPDALCDPTPLAGTEPVVAPSSGMVLFRKDVGDVVMAGDVVAHIIDPLTGVSVEARAATDGVLFARILLRFATGGQRIAKVAGRSATRTGNLLGA
ncbi:succinylglutamate desuccinylase/aspartoacylase family protein [Microvirga antarctica]|uniref:succinylglutamate desuccinylase/aspartoacylase family protein n=1 Tax=Microvirga antarctica TaxID=2819233 RepID=UPI001B30D9C5|nr:succinylglutamate desuccinylase/aspartoacylase family protein [Microvirga antarctica]